MAAPLIAMAAGSTLGGLALGHEQNRQARRDNRRLNAQQQAIWDELAGNMPEFEDWEAILADANLGQMGPTAFEQIHTDPRLKNDQMSQLAALQQIADAGGMTAMDRANMAGIQNQVASQDRGRRDAILQNMQQRGMAGSGNELLAQLQSSQDATQNVNMAGLQTAGQAQMRALDAIMGKGQLAGQMRGQDFGEQSTKAQARDNISQFNAQNRMNVGMHNNQMQNQANYHNTQVNPQRQFDNQRDIAAGRTNQLGQAADRRSQQRDRETDMWGNVIGGASTIGAAYAAK